MAPPKITHHYINGILLTRQRGSLKTLHSGVCLPVSFMRVEISQLIKVKVVCVGQLSPIHQGVAMLILLVKLHFCNL